MLDKLLVEYFPTNSEQGCDIRGLAKTRIERGRGTLCKMKITKQF